MAEHQGQWPITVLCEVLEVSRSSYYDYVERQKGLRDDAEAVTLRSRVRAIHAETKQSYGSRRMAKQLQDEGFKVGCYKARRLMGELELSVKRRARRRPQTTDSRHGFGVAPNLLERRFDVERPDSAWCGDITYIWTEEGWLYLSVLLDLYSRKVVGWAMSDRIDTQLVQMLYRWHWGGVIPHMASSIIVTAAPSTPVMPTGLYWLTMVSVVV